MKVFHYINFLIIFLFLIAICIVEEMLVSSALENVQNYCFEIENFISDKQSLKENQIVLMVDNLEFDWIEDESKLCYLVNHISIKELSYEISHLKAYISNDDIVEFKAALDAIVMYCHSYLHFMGANVHNIL